MLNFASLFSQFRSQSGGLGDLLDQPDVRMGRLLDEEAFLNEYKTASNPKISEFMNYERYEELIEFVTVVGSPEDKKRSYKYPLSACDLLCLDHPNVIDYLFPGKPIFVPETVLEDVEEEVKEKIEEEPIAVQKQEVSAVTEAASEEAVGKETEEKTSQGVAEESATSSEQPQQAQPPKIQTQQEPQVPVVKYRKVKVTRKQERIVQKELPPLIDRLMGYFNGEINYTLAAYVSKVLSSLSNKKTPQFIEYFLQSKFTEAVLNHAESRSVGELIVRILTHESQTCLSERKSFFQAMLGRLSDNSQVYIMSNLSAYVVDAIEKAAGNLKGQSRIAEFADIFFSLETVTQVIRNVMSQQENVSVYSAPVLLAFLTSVPFVLPEEKAVRANFQALVEEFIGKSCMKLNVRAQNHPKIGLGRMKVVEILRFVLKEDILNSRLIIAKNDSFFEILLALLREYPLSSMLHNEIVKIIEMALADSENSPLNQAVLRGNVLLNFIRDEVQEDKKIRAGDSVYKSRKGFIAHLINIAIKLREAAQYNATLRTAIESPEYSEIYQSFFEKEIFNSKKSLAGFLVKRDPKQHEIKFQKEDIISAYATFLRKCPPPVFEEPEPTATTHPDLVEELQKQMEESLSIKHKEEKHDIPKPVESKAEAPPSGETESKYEWALCYDIEEIALDW